MPELDGTSILFGLMVAAVCWLIVNRKGAARRLPVWGAGLVAVIAMFAANPMLRLAGQLESSVPLFQGITTGAVIIGLWFGLLALTVFERKGQPRRVPYWAGVGIGLVAMFVLPPLLDSATGRYQDASLHNDVNRCMGKAPTQAGELTVTNTCDHPIVVGLCLTTEENPDPCAQTLTIAPGAVSILDPRGEQLSALPSTLDGYTLVACRMPYRPSRDLKVGGRGHRGVCLPKA